MRRLNSKVRTPKVNEHNEIRRCYRALDRAWGPQHWWPAESSFEVIVGAYLTQNTAWTNVEQALANLREAGLLTPQGIRRVKLSRLERLIRPSGYFRQKARRLKTFVSFLDRRYDGSLDRMLSQPTHELREELLGLNGVGPETADSILLYAGNHPIFVVDAYTRRIAERHGFVHENISYEDLRSLFEQALAPLAHDKSLLPVVPRNEPGFLGASHPPSRMSTAKRSPLVQIYNEMHGLLVGVGKQYCRKAKAVCDGCPLRPFLPRQ
jgi:endonuclease III related protein